MANGKRSNRKPNGNRRRPRVSKAQPVVQGVGRSSIVPFGSSQMGKVTDGFDALHPRHLSLPRPVAPYCVIRHTGIFSLDADAKLSIWGPTRSNNVYTTGEYYGSSWTSVVGVSCVDSTLQVNAANNARSYALGINGWGTGSSVVPSAFSIQVLNPEALQTTDGIVYLGRLTQRAAVNYSAQTWDVVGQSFVAYQAPRQCSAAKLAFRGVQLDALPSNMNALAEFTSPENVIPTLSTGDVFTWSGGSASTDYMFDGFLPFFIYNPDGIGLRVQVTVEYRFRFDPFSPACAAHTYHHPAPINWWDSAVRAAMTLGHGVRDISDVVATAGQAFQRVRGAMGPAARVLPMLVD